MKREDIPTPISDHAEALFMRGSTAFASEQAALVVMVQKCERDRHELKEALRWAITTRNHPATCICVNCEDAKRLLARRDK